jgi:hypothetical protein
VEVWDGLVAMPLRGRKRKGYPRKEEGAEEAENGEEERQAKGASAARATEDAIFAAGRFHDLGLAPALSDHIHGKRISISRVVTRFQLPV